jgi:hypothetical protein
VHVASLRRKLGRPEWIETVRRVGLRLGDTRSGASPSGARPSSARLGPEPATGSGAP